MSDSGKRLFDLLYIAITNRKSFFGLFLLGLMIFVFTISAYYLVVYTVKSHYPDFQFDIGENNNLVFKSNSKKIVSVLLAANGDYNTPWINTGVSLEKGDKIKISASGKICLAVPQMINSADLGVLPSHPWIGPRGIDPDERYPRNDGRKRPKSWEYRVNPDEFMGRLIGTISNEKPKNRPQKENTLSIGEECEFESQKNGDLWLAINDIWLDRDALYTLIEDTEKRVKQDTIHVPYLSKLRYILKHEYYNAWFDDNAGSFMVNIQLEK